MMNTIILGTDPLTVLGNTLYGVTQNGGSNDEGTVFSYAMGNSSYQSLYSFGNTPGDGEYPQGGLALSGNLLFGTTYQGSSNDYGAVFSIRVDGTGYTNLLAFDPSGNDDGGNPKADLIFLDGSLYGTTDFGGTNRNGIVFSVNTNGTDFSAIYDFVNNPDGANPNGGLCFP